MMTLEERVARLERLFLEKEGSDERFKREYRDMIYNLDDDNFAVNVIKEKQGMKTEIRQTAESIELIAQDVSGLSAELEVTAGRITQEVTDRTNADAELQSSITQTAEAITSEVTARQSADSALSSAITQTAEAVASKVSQTDLENQLINYSTITQTADSIESAVTEVKSYADGEIAEASESIIQQTSSEIATKVSKTANYAGAHRSTTPPTDTSKLWYDTVNEIYKYFNTVSETWVPVDGASIYSIFKQTASGFEFKGNVAIKGDLITSGKISTAGFDGNGNDYIQMQREFITFIDGADGSGGQDLAKMALGFIKDKDGVGIPGIVLGAGDGQGNSRGYITKGTDGLDIFYITNSGSVVRLRLDDNGKLYLNDTEVPAFDEDNPLQDEYIRNAQTWNKAVIGTLDTDGKYKVTDSEIKDGANISASKIEELIVGKNVTMGPNAVIQWANVDNKPDFKPVATSGSYNDLTNKPYIPSVPSYIQSTKITQTTIESPNIVGGIVTGGEVIGGKYWDINEGGYLQILAQSGYADLVLKQADGDQVFKVYDGVTHVTLYGMTNEFLSISNNGCSPLGAWDFSGANVTGLNMVARFA